jgi:tRNA threonylcarbamoyladenosine biosynthesis protein TsaB
MRALAIESSGRTGSIALVEDGVVVREDAFPHGLQHAAGMIPMIDRLRGAYGWQVSDLRQIYVSAGPGSFTGLRIGITLAKTFAFATGAQIVAVPTVKVLAENAPADATNLIIVLDAKREQIFTARFHRSAAGEPWQIAEPAHLDSLSAMLARAPRPVHLLGEGIPYHRQFIPPDDPQIIVTDADTWRARAAAVARIGWAMAQEGRFADPLQLTPIYIRKPEAEEKWDAAQAAAKR